MLELILILVLFRISCQVQEELDIPATPENCSFRVDEDSRTAFRHVSKAVEEKLDIPATPENCYSESMKTPGQLFLMFQKL